MAQSGSAPDWGSGGRWFKSSHPDQYAPRATARHPGRHSHKSQRYKLGELLRDSSDHILLLTATPHKGDPDNFSLFLQLLDRDAYADVRSIRQAMDAGRAPFYLRRTKEAMVHFPERVLQRLLDKLQEIRDALDDDAVFNVVGEVLPAAHVERVLRDYYAGRLGDEDLEERLLRDVDEGHFRNICQNALEGLASRKLNLEMLVERRARARERRVVPETIARFLRDAAPLVPLRLDVIPGLPHTFEPARTPASLRRYERETDWRLPELAARYPRCSTDRETAQQHTLEWVTPGHPLFEAIRRHARERALDPLARGATFHSLAHDAPARIDFYRARIPDPARLQWHEVTKVQHYYLNVDAMTRPMQVRDERRDYEAET